MLSDAGLRQKEESDCLIFEISLKFTRWYLQSPTNFAWFKPNA